MHLSFYLSLLLLLPLKNSKSMFPDLKDIQLIFLWPNIKLHVQANCYRSMSRGMPLRSANMQPFQSFPWECVRKLLKSSSFHTKHFILKMCYAKFFSFYHNFWYDNEGTEIEYFGNSSRILFIGGLWGWWGQINEKQMIILYS